MGGPAFVDDLVNRKYSRRRGVDCGVYESHGDLAGTFSSSSGLTQDSPEFF